MSSFVTTPDTPAVWRGLYARGGADDTPGAHRVTNRRGHLFRVCGGNGEDPRDLWGRKCRGTCVLYSASWVLFARSRGAASGRECRPAARKVSIPDQGSVDLDQPW